MYPFNNIAGITIDICKDREDIEVTGPCGRNILPKNYSYINILLHTFRYLNKLPKLATQ
jgi:hypothetical protein